MQRFKLTGNKKWISATLLLVLVACTLGGIYFRASPSLLPKKIKEQINFFVIYPNSKTSPYTIEQDSIKYDTTNKMLSYIMTKSGADNKIIVSEQPAPDNFSDAPQVYDKFTEKMVPISSFDAYIGKVFITEPPQLNGDQTAVLYTRGTLFFARSQKISTEEWRTFMNDFEVLR